MFKFIRKHRFFFDILGAIVFIIGSFLNFYDYSNSEDAGSTKNKMELFGGIIFGILAIIKMVDAIDSLKKKQNRITE